MTITDVFQKKAVFVPLVSTVQTEESYWLGAMLTDLLIRHLAESGIPTEDYNVVAKATIAARLALPLDSDGVDMLASELQSQALIHGVYIIDMAASMLGVRLKFHPDSTQSVLETSTPFSAFTSFIPRLTLSIIERLGVTITDEMRKKVNLTTRPQKFEAFQQVAKARAAWMRGEYELALTSIEGALSMDSDYEEAMLAEVMIARSAGDAETVQKAFKRWAQQALRAGDNAKGGERITKLGHWMVEKGEWQNARVAYENAMAQFSKAGDKVGELRLSNNLANLDLLQGKNLNVIRRYRKNLRELEVEPQFAEDRAITYLNLGIAYKSQGQYPEAEQALADAFASVSPTQNQQLEGYIVGEQGALYSDMDRWEDAQEALSRALAIFMRAGDHAGKAIVKTHQGLLARSQGNLRGAEVLLRAALAECQEPVSQHVLGIVSYNLGDLLYVMGEKEKGLGFAQKANEIFLKLNSAEKALSAELLEKLSQSIDADSPVMSYESNETKKSSVNPTEE